MAITRETFVKEANTLIGNNPGEDFLGALEKTL